MSDGSVALRAPVSAGRSEGNLCETDRTSEAKAAGYKGGLSLRVARKFLGGKACTLSDQQLASMLEGMRALANLILDAVAEEQSASPWQDDAIRADKT
jgi:hypothetical protein